MKRIIVGLAALVASSFLLVGCGDSDADVAAKNISKAAEQFEIDRRIVFFNGITDKYLLVIEGRCSIEADANVGGSLSVTCKTGNNEFKKHYVGLSDNVSYLVEQTTGASVSTTRYRVIFKPETIVPNFDRP
jgi:hypothetical protein